MTATTSPATYRIVRHRQARGDFWTVEGMTADGAGWTVAVCDDRHEARETVRRLEAHEARQAARQRLADARQAARRVDDRRFCAGRLPPDAVARLRLHSPSLVAERAAIAAVIRDARRTLARLSKNST